MPTIAKSPVRVSWSTREFVKSVTTSPPAERMIVLEVDVWRNVADEIEHFTKRLSVVSLETSLIHHWSRRDRDGEPDKRHYATEQELQETDSSYRFQCQEVRRDVVVMSPDSEDGELTTLTELREHKFVDVVYRLILVICDWPKSEDKSQLDRIVSEAVAEATACLQRESQQPIGRRMES